MANSQNLELFIASADAYLTQMGERERMSGMPIALAYTQIQEIFSLSSTPFLLPRHIRREIPAFRAFVNGEVNKNEIQQRETLIKLYGVFEPIITSVLEQAKSEKTGVTKDGVYYWPLDPDPEPAVYGIKFPDGRRFALKTQKILRAIGRREFNENITSLIRSAGNPHTPDIFAYEPLKGHMLIEIIDGKDFALNDELLDSVIDASLSLVEDNVQIDSSISNLKITEDDKVIWIDTILPGIKALDKAGKFIPEYQLANLVYTIQQGFNVISLDAKARLLESVKDKTFQGRPIDLELLAEILKSY